MLWGFLLGVLISLLSLLPGVHVASLLLITLPFVGTDIAVSAACTSVGCSSMLGVLGALRTPVTKASLGFSDIATKMAYKGYADAVVRIHAQAVWTAFGGVAVLAAVTSICVLLGHNLLQQITGLLKALMPWILGFVLATVIWRSSRPFKTTIIVVLATTLGFWVFNGPALRSNPWVMTPLLSGLFMIGPTVGMLTLGQLLKVPDHKDNIWEVEPTVEVKGAIVGCITGFLAGIGTSSLVSLVAKDLAEEDYLALQASADAANNFFAILGFVLIGSTRSGTAAALATIAPSVSVFDALIYFLLILAGLLIGDRLLTAITETIALGSPGKLTAMITLTATVGMIANTTGLAGVLVLLASWQLSSLARSWRVPNQALLAVMIGPVLLYYLGLTTKLI